MSSREIMETVVTAFLNITQISLVCQSIQDMQKKKKNLRNYISDKANCLQKKTFNSSSYRVHCAHRTLWPNKFTNQENSPQKQSQQRFCSPADRKAPFLQRPQIQGRGKKKNNSAFAVKFRGSHLSVTWHLSLPAWKSLTQFPALFQPQTCSLGTK